MTTLHFDPRDEGLLTDPYPTYRRLRDEDPLHPARIGPSDVWVLSHFEDVARVLQDRSALTQPPGGHPPEVFGDGPAARMWRNSMSSADPDAHRRLRRLVGKVFSPKTMKEQRRHIERIVDEALAALVPRREMEVMDEFAKAVPVQVICGMLGIPPADWDLVTSWTPDMIRMFAPDANDTDEIRLCQQACQNFFDYFGSVIDDRRKRPGDDVLSELVAVREAGEGLTDDELIVTARSLLTAGFETTMALIGNGVLAMLQFPGEMERLAADDRLLTNAIEEFLRWEAPVHTQIRHPTVASPWVQARGLTTATAPTADEHHVVGVAVRVGGDLKSARAGEGEGLVARVDGLGRRAGHRDAHVGRR
jgi:cytochrome P450